MKNTIIPGAEPFFLPGGKVGCVLVHGFTGAPKEMRLMGDHLQQEGITCLSVRLAGHGTDIKDMIRTRWHDWLASVEDGMHLLQGSCDEIFLAGLSMGGLLSLLAAALHPVQGVIALSTPFEINTDWRIKIAKPLSLIIPTVGKDKSDVKDEAIAASHIDYPAYPTRSVAEFVSLLDTVKANLCNIHSPVLMINSKLDGSVSEQDQEKYRQALQHTHFEPLMLQESRHVITEDIEREIVFQHALDFIRSHSHQGIK